MSEQQIEWLSVEDSAIELEGQPELSQMEKIAQRRGFIDWLHEKVNVPRRMAETFSNVYGDVMNTLRDVDDRIRQQYAVNLRSNLSESKKALKERRYLDIVHFLSEFNESLKQIAEQATLLHQLRGEQIDDFYGNSEHFDWKRDYFGKEAGVMDMFRPLTRPMAGRIMERMYQNTLRERYRKMEALISEARIMFNFTMDRLKKMGAARARGDVSDYMAQLDQIGKRRQGFENVFRQIYNTEITPMIERMRSEREQREKDENMGQEQLQEMRALRQKRVDEESRSEMPPAAPVAAPLEVTPEEQPMDIAIETENEPVPPLPQALTEEETRQVAQAMAPGTDEFLMHLIAMAKAAKKSDAFIANTLLKYSEKLDDMGIDEEFSMKLLAMAEGFVDG